MLDGGNSSGRWGDDYRPNRVYFTWADEDGDLDPDELIFGENTYEVEPIGEIERDPEDRKQIYNDWMAPGARVVRKVNARRTAMPVGDAYDLHYRDQSPDQTPTRPGPWYHASPQELPEGTVLDTTHKKNFPYREDYQPRNDWVWMDRSPSLVGHWAPHVYEVEPLDEGPHAYNGTGFDGFVSPRARVVRKIRGPKQYTWQDAKERYQETFGKPMDAET